METDELIKRTDGAAWENYAAERLRAHHAAAIIQSAEGRKTGIKFLQ